MLNGMKNSIFALSSGNQKSAVSVFRISGINILPQIKRMLKQSQKLNLNENFFEERKFYLKNIYSIDNHLDLIDQALLVYFPKNKSYTGQEMVEIHTHGSVAVQRKMLEEFQKLENFRLAEAGEFSRRAFLNGKLDLYQIENLKNLIDCQSENERKLYTRNQSENYKILQKWRKQLIEVQGGLEVLLDNDELELDIDLSKQLDLQFKRVFQIVDEMKKQLQNYKKIKRVVQGGVKVCIMGRVNSGKSSLINKLCSENISIVSEIEGTTRDLIKSKIQVNGQLIELVDTAGIRETNDLVEKMGIQKAIEYSQESDLIIYLISQEDLEKGENGKVKFKKEIKLNQKEIQIILDEKTKVIINKNDLGDLNEIKQEKNFVIEIQSNKKQIEGSISCLKNQNMEILYEILNQKSFDQKEIYQEEFLIIDSRQEQEIQECVKYLEIFIQKQKQSEEIFIDLACEDIRNCLTHLGKLVGRVDIEEVLDLVFKEFCIGK